MRPHWVIAAMTICAAASIQPCGAEDQAKRSFHEKVGWKAEDFFKDPQVIALCRAIEANDLKEIDRLVAAGVDVNARGEGNMTPLLWSFFDNKLGAVMFCPFGAKAIAVLRLY